MNDIMLIVDDAEMNREVLKVLFNKKYDFMEAENGEEALEIIKRCQGSIDIVLLDLMMGGMTGFDVLEERKNLDYFKDIPVVVITSSGHLEDQIKAFDLGANDFISKPFEPEIVISRVNNVMASNRRMLFIEMEAQKLKIKSEMDEITGLLNKTTTEITMDNALKTSKDKLNVMMVIDIDNFKTVNDTSGHQNGDHVIKIIANLISGIFRKTDIIGRIGGDEFCVMMNDVPSMDIVYSKINELIQTMRYKPNLAIPEYVTLSIGMVTNEKRNTTYANMFKKADSALYNAKQNGKGQYREYGVEPENYKLDKRSVAILISNNRNVCSTVHALIPNSLRIVEALQLENLDNIEDDEKDKTLLVFADISDLNGETDDFFDKLKSYEWIDMKKVMAICKEGNVAQYLTALNNNIADMFTTPIDGEAFKRRTTELLEQFGHK